MKSSTIILGCLVLLAIFSGSSALKLNQAGVNLIKSFEGWVLLAFLSSFFAISLLASLLVLSTRCWTSVEDLRVSLTLRYKDPVGLPTIGYGHLIKKGDPYKSGTSHGLRYL